jgi:3',5'-cyclic AMP phosphodiesterase CpdA
VLLYPANGWLQLNSEPAKLFPFIFPSCIVVSVIQGIQNRRSKVALLIIGLALILIPLYAEAQHQAPFAIISDTHIRAGNNNVYPAFLHRMEEEKINHIIHVGDAIDAPGSTSQWTRFLRLTGPDRILHLTPGNHDIRGKKSLALYLRLFQKPYYSFADGDTLFVFLNTELPGEESRIAGEQLAWLKAELEKPFKYKFVFLHEPLYPLLSGHGLDRYAEARDVLHRLFAAKGVSLVLSGHDHIYGRTTKDNILYVTAATLGGPLPLFMDGSEVFKYITTTRNGEGYSFTVWDMEGHTKDRFIINR